MIRESCRAGGLARKDAKMLAAFPSEKMSAVWEFLELNQLLRGRAAE